MNFETMSSICVLGFVVIISVVLYMAYKQVLDDGEFSRWEDGDEENEEDKNCFS